VVPIDILHLVDRLEALLQDGWRLPLTSNRVVSEEEFLEIIDQMRVSVPQEVRQARRVQQERDRILAQAQEEANRVVALAHERVEALAEQHEVVRAAEVRAEEITVQASQEAKTIRSEADDYVIAALEGLEGHLADLLTQVRNGLAVVRGERTPAQATGEESARLAPGESESGEA
jgi:vacuolar-type H+-ATPase subunit H